jgi:restriction system protein
MALPDFETIMLPLLKITSDQKEHQLHDSVDKLAEEFKLTSSDRNKLLPNGVGRHFDNKVGWARFHLVKAGLLESTKRGYFKISTRGLKVLAQQPLRIDVDFLKQFPEFVEMIKAPIKKKIDDSELTNTYTDKQSPEEAIAYGYERMKTELVKQLLDEVSKTSPSFFEKLVIELLVKMGYGGSLQDAGEVIGKTGDEGIDGVIKEDPLGLDAIYIQAKRWGNTVVSRPELQKFVGALQGQKAKKGVYITTSKFSQEATNYVAKVDCKVVLIDGNTLADLMVEHDIGVSTVNSYKIKKIDFDYFIGE